WFLRARVPEAGRPAQVPAVPGEPELLAPDRDQDLGRSGIVMTQADLVTLRTGEQVHSAVLSTVRLTLKRLMADGHGVAVYELVQLANNPDHVLFGNSDQKLEAYGLIDDGQLHRDAAAVVRASFDEGLEWVSAVAE